MSGTQNAEPFIFCLLSVFRRKMLHTTHIRELFLVHTICKMTTILLQDIFKMNMQFATTFQHKCSKIV